MVEKSLFHPSHPRDKRSSPGTATQEGGSLATFSFCLGGGGVGVLVPRAEGLPGRGLDEESGETSDRS